MPRPCTVRLLRTGACGGSFVYAATTPTSLRPGTTVTSIAALGPVGVSIASGPMPPPPAAGRFAKFGLLSLSFCERPMVPKSPLAKLLEATLLNGSGTSLATGAGRVLGRFGAWSICMLSFVCK